LPRINMLVSAGCEASAPGGADAAHANAMHVAIDCRSLQDRPIGGVGRSIVNVLPHLAAAAELDVLLDSRMPDAGSLPPDVAAHRLRGPLSGRGFTWLQVAAPRWLRRHPGVFHCPFYGLPYWQPVPMVVTIHDLTFEFPHDWYSAQQRFAFQRQARWAARTARRIIVHSEHVRTELLERYGRHGATAERIVVARFPVDPGFVPEPPGMESALARLGVRQPYVAALGGSGRRQLPVAVAAWSEALRRSGRSGPEVPLVVVGTEEPPTLPGVLYAGPVDDRDWAAVLAGASAFCYATSYEGYGIPALEAASCGTPVVCARVGSLPELLGDGAAWCEEPRAEQLGASLASVLTDEGRRARLTAIAFDRVRALPDWPDVAAVTLRAYRDALAG
jgi:glycosyltransferase involved in cell wall biosynthesis